MFGSRRHRPPNPPLTAATANPNAATAAAAVFKRHESNNNSLSAAAAAAALRARPTTPTRVADVQTKRTVRRSASVASTGTASDRVPNPSGLRRRGSSGSMTERTFRTPSPHRPGSSGSAQRRSQSLGDDTPPVPALPSHMDPAPGQPERNIQQDARHRKANNLVISTAPVRLASQKLASGEAPSWFGAAKLGDLGNVRRTDPAMASPPSSPLQLLPRDVDLSEGARPASQASSINFSYPTRARRGSANTIPTAADQSAAAHIQGHTGQVQPVVQGQQPSQASRAKDQPRVQPTLPFESNPAPSTSLEQTLVYDPNSRRMVPQADLLPVQQAVLNAALAPTRPKKKKRTPQRAGSHLAAGTMGRAKTAIPSPAPAAKSVPPGGTAQVEPPRQVPPTGAAPAQEAHTDAEEPAGKADIASPGMEARRFEQPRPQQATELLSSNIPPAVSDTAQFAVRRQPSVVREEPEPEDVGDERETQKVISDALDAVPGSRRMQPGALPDTGSSTSPTPKSTVSPSSSSEDPSAVGVIQRPKTGSIDVSEDGKPKPGATEHGRAANVSRDRNHSNSPARQAHFGPVQDTLMVKHSPPPRSISPRKSAMKHTSPPRGASPSDDTSEASGNVKQEAPVARKKSVRVSFDDVANGAVTDSTAANQGESPLAAGPLQTNRHSWLANLGRGQDLPSLDDDVVMKPRPALPSFGSVRDRKPRDTSPTQTERPLVRPKGETRYPATLLPSPPLGSSNDHALGAVLSKEQARLKDGSGDMEGTSRNGEPLPPVVTSVEGSGYFSDTSDNSSILSSEFEQPEAFQPATVPEPRPELTVSSQSEFPKPPVNGSAVRPVREIVSGQTTVEQEVSPQSQIPAISVSQPTPLGAENKPVRRSVMDVPGGFPEDESDQSAASAAKMSVQVTTVTQPADVTQQGSQSARQAAETVEPAAAEDSSDSDSEVYSDAYEDLSEIEGDGFQSLDAVVDSPLQQSPRPSSHRGQASRDAVGHEPTEEPSKLQTQISSTATALEIQHPESPQDEWERAKAYWRSLTTEQRAQLEREAMEEAGLGADKDEAERQVGLGKQKTVERAVLAAHKAQKVSAQQEQESTRDPDRSYMIKPGERWTGKDERDVPPMRKTMRDKTQNEAVVNTTEGSRLRKSMRANGPSPPRSDHPLVPGNQAVSKRPVSSPPAAATLTKTKHRRSATQAELPSREADSLRPLMVRRGSTGSESSFKRSRSAKGQGVGFRSSLRPTSPPSTQGDQPSSKRFSLRTLSPAGSDSRQNGGSPLASTSASPQMRTTLRDQSSGRKSSGGIRIPSFSLSYGGGKKSGSKTGGNKSSGSRFSSRFADSSDEEGPSGFSSGFRSRFDDSSDDEPVMPIPLPLPQSTSAPYAAPGGTGHHLRKESSIASTALPEELEEDSDEPQSPAGRASETNTGLPPSLVADTTTNLRRTRSGRGQLPGSLTAPSLSQAAENNATSHERASKRRNSFMSVLRHRKKDRSAAKIGRPEIQESAARRDTKLERSVGQLERIRSRGGGREEEGDGEGVEEEAVLSPSLSPSPRSPRLQKRGSQRAASTSGIAASRTAGGMGLPAAVAPPATGAASAARATGAGENEMFLGGGDRAQEQLDAFGPAQVKRSGTSGNLGTRTLSGGGFLHFAPQRRVSSMGLEPAASVEGSVAGSMAGASSTTRKKRFGALRRILGIHD